MSYGILYRSIAIKHPTEEKFLILSEYGDNNVWETNKRRARSWGGDCIAGSHRGKFCTPAELEASLRSIDFSSGCYAFYGGRRDFTSHWAVYKRAIKHAVEIDQLRNFGLNFRQWCGNSIGYSCKHVSDLETLQSEQTRLEAEGYSYYLIGNVWDDYYRKIYPKVKRVTKVVQNPTHVISIIGYGYFIKRSSRRLLYRYSMKGGKGFASEKDAQRTLDSIKKRYSNLEFEIVPIKK